MTYPCADCGYVLRHDFVMPDDLWNEVTGQPEIILCYDCFCDRAEEKGYIPVFKCALAHSSNRTAKK